MQYTRVAPRDLFNESKLLKCLGQLALIIHDGFDNQKNRAPQNLYFTQTEPGEFRIEQDRDGGLYVASGLAFFATDTPLQLCSIYNSKDNYPLLFLDARENVEYPVFTETGALTEEFINYVLSEAP